MTRIAAFPLLAFVASCSQGASVPAPAPTLAANGTPIVAASPATPTATASSPVPAPIPVPAALPAPTSTPIAGDLSGRWTGVEGMHLDISRAGPASWRLAMQYDLDHKGVFEGLVEGDGVVFVRNGIKETLRRSDGAATGLKWLDGKRDCLMVKPGEGYCRG